MAKAEEVANPALFFASGESAYCTGSELLVGMAAIWRVRTGKPMNGRSTFPAGPAYQFSA